MDCLLLVEGEAPVHALEAAEVVCEVRRKLVALQISKVARYRPLPS